MTANKPRKLVLTADFRQLARDYFLRVLYHDNTHAIRLDVTMNVPQQYPYNPQLRLILWASGAGFAWIGIQRLSWGRLPTGFSLWFGLAPVVLAMLLVARRLTLNRSLLLNEDEMILPTGFLQTGTARIPYSSVQGVWRHYLPATVVLRVATERRTYEIVSMLLPDRESYLAIEEFLTAKARENTPSNGAG